MSLVEFCVELDVTLEVEFCELSCVEFEVVFAGLVLLLTVELSVVFVGIVVLLLVGLVVLEAVELSVQLFWFAELQVVVVLVVLVVVVLSVVLEEPAVLFVSEVLLVGDVLLAAVELSV